MRGKRITMGVAALAAVLSGSSTLRAQAIPKGRPPEWGVALGYGAHFKLGPGNTDFGAQVLTPSGGFRISSRLEFLASATYERYVSPSGYFIGVLPAGARLSIGNGPIYPYLSLGLGFGWTDLAPSLSEISRRFNFRVEGSFGARFPAGERSAWTLECRWQHTSNAGTVYPNQGLNALFGLVGFRFH